MIDVLYIREKSEVLREALEKRGIDTALVDRLQELDRARRGAIREADELRARRNQLSKEVARRKKAGEPADEIIAEVRALGQKLKELEEKEKQLTQEFRELMALVPNIPHPSVPVGRDERDNVVVREWGERRAFDFEPKPHWDLGPQLGILDFEASAKMSGARFVLYKGKGALLERALINFFLDLHTREHGYTEVFPPVLVRPESMFASGHLPKFEEEMYYAERDNLYLIPTAEVSLANLHRDTILREEDLPLYYVSYTPCFRREAGSYGRDVRGMIRLHQFNKVELFKYTTPETSYDELESMLANAERVLQLLGIPYRVVALCTGDLGFAAAKTYDIEAWAPGLKRWLEVSSVSNTESFQARRANVRFRRKDGKLEYVHTLNGSGLATPRTFIALIENYQQKDGSVVIPEVLRPYMNGLEVIEPR